MKIRKLIAGALALVLCVGLTACKGQNTTTSSDKDDETTTTTTAPGERDEMGGTVYADKQSGFQTELPEEGEEIAILHTSMGDIYVRLFPEAAPKAVKNFVTLAKNNYYDGLIFHRVIENFMIQGGDPKGNGTGGESCYGAPFEDEFDSRLHNLYGALAMANNGTDTNGSQFFINQKDADAFGTRETYTPEFQEGYAKELYEGYLTNYTKEELATYGINGWEDFVNETYVYDWIPEETWDAYLKHGGNLHLDGAFRRSGGHTVFGQVFLGMNVVESIAAVEVDESDKPKTAVVINDVEITVYKK